MPLVVTKLTAKGIYYLYLTNRHNQIMAIKLRVVHMYKAQVLCYAPRLPCQSRQTPEEVAFEAWQFS